MKKINLFFIMLGALALGLFSCAEDKLEGESTTKVEVKFEAALSDMIEMKSGALDDMDVPYCDSASTSVMYGDSVWAEFEIMFEGGRAYADSWSWKVDGTDNMSRLSDLRQFDFQEGETYAKIKFTKFEVYRDGTLKFLTPMYNSAFADYVKNPVGTEYVIDLYAKKYIYTEVLCFVEEDIPLFGFAWSDFDLVFGDEICFFFNCLGATSSTYHQVFAAQFDAYFMSDDSWGSEPYWSGYNYTDQGVPAEITPFCIPAPGNWATEGIMVYVTPMGHAEPLAAPIWISPDQINAFLNSDQSMSWDESAYMLEVGMATDVPFLHYTMKDCYKSDAYYTNILEGKMTEVYAVNLDEISKTVVLTKIFDTEVGNYHIAVTPDETKVMLISETLNDANDANGANLYVYDIYTLEYKELEYAGDGNYGVDGVFNFTQLVYIKDKLYAGCKANSVIVPIEVDIEAGTYVLGTPKFPEADVSGGDLLGGYEEGVGYTLYSFTRVGNYDIIKYSSAGTATYNVSGLNNNTGACVLESGNRALVSFISGDSRSFRVWDNGTLTNYTSVGLSDESFVGADLASAFNSLQPVQLQNIFVQP